MNKKGIFLICIILLLFSFKIFSIPTKTYTNYVLGFKFNYPVEVDLGYIFRGYEDTDNINHKYKISMGINNIDELNASPYAAGMDFYDEFKKVESKKDFMDKSEDEYKNISLEYFEYKNKVIGQISFLMRAPDTNQGYSRSIEIKIKNYFVSFSAKYFDFWYSIPDRYPDYFYRNEETIQKGDKKGTVLSDPLWKEPVDKNYVEFYNLIKNKSPKAPQELVKLWEYFDVILNSFELFEPAEFVTPTVENLSLRTDSSLNSSRIRMVTKGEKLTVMDDIDPPTLIDGVYGFWVKVKTDQGEVGWCFDAYLEPYDGVKKK